jgi:Xaa-Pro aminopeptidase
MQQSRERSVLAGELRRKLFEGVADDVAFVISSEPRHKGYLSGYHSMTHDLAPFYQSAVIATREWAALVVGAADAGPALETIGDPRLVFRYGAFFFETSPGAEPTGYDEPGAPSFRDAVAQALAALVPDGLRIGVDRTNGDTMWAILAELRGEQAAVDVSRVFRTSRATKTAGEVARIRKATQLVEEGIKAAIERGRVGMTEHEVAAIVTEPMVRGGGVPRFVSATSGPRAALADSYPTDRCIEAGDFLRLDVGCVVDGYCSDMARTICFGLPDERQATYYDAIGVGLETELAMVRAGVTAGALFAKAVETVRRNGIPSYKRQHCGHGIGLSGHEYPIIAPESDAVLEPGMCLCIETPYYQLGWTGMMVEDTILVTSSGYEPITTMPRRLFVV